MSSDQRNTFRSLINSVCNPAVRIATNTIVSEAVQQDIATSKTLVETNYRPNVVLPDGTVNIFEIYVNGLFADTPSIVSAKQHVISGEWTGGLPAGTLGKIPNVYPCPSTYTGDNGIVYTDIRDDNTTCFTKNYGRGAGRVPDKKACTDWDSRFTDDGTSCWLTGYDRGAGTIPNACPSGYTNVGGVCYKYGGYWNYTWGAGSCNGPMQKPLCNRYGCGNCCGGYNDCYQTWMPTIDASQLPSCPADRPDKNAGLCYPNCRSGYYGAATMCLPSDQIVGIKKTAMDRYLCKPEEELWGALCYPKCKPGYTNDACCICRPDKGYMGFKWLWDRQYCDKDWTNIAGLCYGPPAGKSSSTGWYTSGGFFYSNDQVVPAKGFSNIIYFGANGSDTYLQFKPVKITIEAINDPDNALNQCNGSFPISLNITPGPNAEVPFYLTVRSGRIKLDMKEVLLKLKPLWFNIKFDMVLDGFLNHNFPVHINPASPPPSSLLIINNPSLKMYLLIPPEVNPSTTISKRLNLSSIPMILMTIATLAAGQIGNIPGTCGLSKIFSITLCAYNIYKFTTNSDPLYDRFNNFIASNIDPISNYISNVILSSITLKTDLLLDAAKAGVYFRYYPLVVPYLAMTAYEKWFEGQPLFRLKVTNIYEDSFFVGWNDKNPTSKFLEIATGYGYVTPLALALMDIYKTVTTIMKAAAAAGDTAMTLIITAATAGFGAIICPVLKIITEAIDSAVCPMFDLAFQIKKCVDNVSRDKSGDLSPYIVILSILIPSILNAIGINRNMGSLFTGGSILQNTTTAPVITPAPTTPSTVSTMPSIPSIAATNSVGGIYYSNSNLNNANCGWTQVPGSLSWVSNSNGKLYGVNSGGQLYYTNNNSTWNNITAPSGVVLVQVSLDGYQNVVMGIGRDQSIWYANQNIYSSPNWTRIGGALTNVSVSNGQAYGCNAGDAIFYASNAAAGNWVQIGGALTCVSFDGYNNIVVGSNRGGSCFYATNARAGNWVQMNGGGVTNISYSNGKMACAAGANVYFATNFTTGNWVSIGNAAKQVSYDDPTMYYKRDYTQFTSIGGVSQGDVDLPGNPFVGTLYDCQNSCNNNESCIGFSREKAALDTGMNQCWMKKASNQVTYNHPTWNTYVKPSKASSWPR